ncbi:MAG: hypothetical protein ACLUFN_00925 [Eubacterium sp.]
MKKITVNYFCFFIHIAFAASLQDIGNELPDNCTMLEEFGAYRPEVKSSQPALLEWLHSLGIEY